MTVLFLDLETFCETPIKHGTHIYAERAEIMLFLFAWDDEPVQCLDLVNDPDAPRIMGEIIEYAKTNNVEVVAHKSDFDRNVLRYHDHEIPIEQWHDTMVRALAHGLPGSLDKLSTIFRLGDKAKDKAGKKLIQLFCVPRPKKQKLRRATRDTHPVEWQKFIDYGMSDIEAMRVLYNRLPRWNYQGKELALWHLDQRINDRGIAVDANLATAAIETVKLAQADLAQRTDDATFGYVDSATKRTKLLEFINSYWEFDLPDLKADTIEKLLKEDNTPNDLHDLLTVRLQASTTSVTKYKRVLNGMSHDKRLRGLLKFCGAARTGRWAGQLFQPQNLMRPTLKNDAIENGIWAMKGGYAIDAYPNVMEIAANAMRGVLLPTPGKKMIVADLANIEGRAAAYLAAEEWKLGAFRLYDAGKGEDLYKIAYARMFNCEPEDVDDVMRQIGKVCELMLQYEGGVGAWITGAMTYGIDLQSMANNAINLLPPKIRREANKAYGWACKRDRAFGLAENTYVVCDAFKRMWREAHPGITDTWEKLDEALRGAIENPKRKYKIGLITVVCDGKWLKVILPSGRALSYPSPRIERGKISYMGVHIYTKQWKRIYTYGGKTFENICQAFARDVMAENMPYIEDEGYEILLTVHDEDITETPDDPYFTAEGLAALMIRPIDWCPGIPLAAKGAEMFRYRKA